MIADSWLFIDNGADSESTMKDNSYARHYFLV